VPDPAIASSTLLTGHPSFEPSFIKISLKLNPLSFEFDLY